MIYGEFTTSSFHSLLDFFLWFPVFVLFVRTTPVDFKSPLAATRINETVGFIGSSTVRTDSVLCLTILI